MELKVYTGNGQLAFSGCFHSPVLAFGRRRLPDGQYAFQVLAGRAEVLNGIL